MGFYDNIGSKEHIIKEKMRTYAKEKVSKELQLLTERLNEYIDDTMNHLDMGLFPDLIETQCIRTVDDWIRIQVIEDLIKMRTSYDKK